MSECYVTLSMAAGERAEQWVCLLTRFHNRGAGAELEDAFDNLWPEHSDDFQTALDECGAYIYRYSRVTRDDAKKRITYEYMLTPSQMQHFGPLPELLKKIGIKGVRVKQSTF